MSGALSSLTEIALVALGSALGAMARFALGRFLLRSDFGHPIAATLAVNLSGSGLAGFLAGFAGPANVMVAGFLVTGFLGSYTTVSSFSLETSGLWQSGRERFAAGYVLISTAGCLLVAWAGWWLGANGGVVS